MSKTWDECQDCGMVVRADEYHPLAACLMYEASKNQNIVRSNLNAVVEHGRKKRDLSALREAVEGLEVDILSPSFRGVERLTKHKVLEIIDKAERGEL